MADVRMAIRELTDFDPLVVGASDKLVLTATAMAGAHCDAALIRRRDDQLAVLTEHDLLRGLAEGDDNTWAADVMSREVVEVDAGLPLADAVTLMIERGIRHLVVRDGDRVGILSQRDCVGPLLGAATS